MRSVEDARSQAAKFAKLLLYLKIGMTLIAVLAVLAAWLKSGLTGGPLIAVSIAGGFFSLLFWFWNHQKDYGDAGAWAQVVTKNLESGSILQRTLTFTDEQAWMEHEHGVMVFVGVDDGSSLFLDLSSVSDDPRYSRYEDKTLFRREWSWYQFAGDAGHVFEFQVRGDPFEPMLLGEHTLVALEVFEHLGSPGDGEVIQRPCKDIIALLREKLPKGA